MSQLARPPRPARCRLARLASLALALWATPLWAIDELARIQQLELLPESPAEAERASAAPAAGSEQQVLYAEWNAERMAPRQGGAPRYPSAVQTGNVTRALLDARLSHTLAERLQAQLSGRFTGLQGELLNNGAHSRLDLREAYVQWQPAAATYLEAGRLNVRSGVAYGFNPTDHFRTGSIVDPTTQDPAALRQNRLGTALLRLQHLGDEGALSVLVSPRLTDDARLDTQPAALDLRLNQTNPQTRWMVKGVLHLAEDFSPEWVLFHQAGQWRLGGSATHSLDNQHTVYAEWSAGRSRSVFGEALQRGVASGDLPPQALAADTGAAPGWQHDLAAGWSWSSPHHLTLTAEFDLHTAGFSAAEWARWFALGSSPDSAALARYIRAWAAFHQAPLSRRSLFLRAQWDQALLRDLTLSSFVKRNLDDASWLCQFSADYRIGSADRLRLSAVVNAHAGPTEFGSTPNRLDLVAAYTHFF